MNTMYSGTHVLSKTSLMSCADQVNAWQSDIGKETMCMFIQARVKELCSHNLDIHYDELGINFEDEMRGVMRMYGRSDPENLNNEAFEVLETHARRIASYELHRRKFEHIIEYGSHAPLMDRPDIDSHSVRGTETIEQGIINIGRPGHKEIVDEMYLHC